MESVRINNRVKSPVSRAQAPAPNEATGHIDAAGGEVLARRGAKRTHFRAVARWDPTPDPERSEGPDASRVEGIRPIAALRIRRGVDSGRAADERSHGTV
jgi:hypothetical protein